MKIRYTTTIEETLVAKVRDIVKTSNLKGSNVVFEEALYLYFNKPIILEKIVDDTVQRIIITNDEVLFEVVQIATPLDKETFNIHTALANGFMQVN